MSGPPGRGKTPVARQLASALGLPLLAKDTLKQGLMAVLPVPDVAASRLLGTAALAGLLAVAEEVGCGVLDSVWHRSRAVQQLGVLAGPVVEVFCRVDSPTAQARFAARAATRGPGHFDADRGFGELWNADTTVPVAGGWPVLEVDTATAVNLPALVTRIRHASAN